MYEIHEPLPTYTLTFTNENQAIAAIKGSAMLSAIKTYHGDCIRNIVKHREMSKETAAIVDEIVKKLNEHFEEFDGLMEC